MIWDNTDRGRLFVVDSNRSDYALLLEIVAAFVVANILHASGLDGVMAGVHFGLLCGIGIAASMMGVNYLFQRRSVKLYLIDAGHIVLGLAIVGAIVGAWR